MKLEWGTTHLISDFATQTPRSKITDAYIYFHASKNIDVLI